MSSLAINDLNTTDSQLTDLTTNELYGIIGGELIPIYEEIADGVYKIVGYKKEDPKIVTL